MIDNARRILKEKYSLVHIPSRHRVQEWADRVRVLVKDGTPVEQAGSMAAAEVFRYEFKPHRITETEPVEKILSFLIR